MKFSQELISSEGKFPQEQINSVHQEPAKSGQGHQHTLASATGCITQTTAKKAVTPVCKYTYALDERKDPPRLSHNLRATAHQYKPSLLN